MGPDFGRFFVQDRDPFLGLKMGLVLGRFFVQDKGPPYVLLFWTPKGSLVGRFFVQAKGPSKVSPSKPVPGS